MNGNRKKVKRAGIILLTAICIIATVAAVIDIKFMNLETYIIESNGDVISSNGVIYKFNSKLTSDYMGGDLKAAKAIGKVKGDGIWGRRVYKLKGIDDKNSIAIRGLMLQEVHTNEQYLQSGK
ncbi:hypothetical protein [Paenibacillus protaetiae]|uniref:Uncharacterized protein n=1 Tax=Paenibacillus protaetiae TaxID=2509456 RepID=A0A4P6EUJ0_9BACL|nr:hypothetical protein [Paenibacillus protaetiae]QAY65309.1 hypothetical protein ET464_01850 [Paenibacillus protaetiae]